MITVSSTLFRYVSKQFLINFLVLMLLLMGVIFLFDIVELMRRASNQTDVHFNMVLTMALLKIPEVGQMILPMGILFSAIYTCWKMNRTSELVVIRSAGLSAWQFLSPLLLTALLIGIFTTMVINPISSIFLSKYDQMEIIHFQKNSNLVTVSRTGIWLRQPAEDGYALIHSASFEQENWKLSDVSILFFDNKDGFVRRIDGPVAYLREGYWEITEAVIHDRAGSERAGMQKILTDLTAHKIEESFADPETISFWEIPEYIRIMEETGFPATKLHIHFQSLIAKPFLFAAMILLAAAFSLRPQRFGGTALMIVLGVTAGFFIFFTESMLQAFGVSQKIPVYLAAWTPAVVTLLLGVTAVLHLEDG